MTTTPINKTDLAMLKLSYSPEEFGLLEAALQYEPELVADFISKVNPTGFSDTAAYDRVICSLFVHARDEYNDTYNLPVWADLWADNNWPDMPTRDFQDIDIFSVNSRYNRISLVSA